MSGSTADVPDVATNHVCRAPPKAPFVEHANAQLRAATVLQWTCSRHRTRACSSSTERAAANPEAPAAHRNAMRTHRHTHPDCNPRQHTLTHTDTHAQWLC
jgi:hypothetical protein